jgi:hypothetical protein
MGFSVYDEKVPIWRGSIILNAQGTTRQPVTSTASGTQRLDQLIAHSTDTIAHDVLIEVFNGVLFYPLAVVTIPALAGTAGVPPVDLLPLLPATLQTMVLPPLYSIQITMLVAVVSPLAVTLHAIGGVL